ncbi:hypothetical protein TrST_g9034 [Triparma strigata]|uniref:Leucine-rich repeat domain-containing protein n=1 Tax=Triparma strigata TaxID=1606541 RepID=A0A9W6ZTY1_9STRA|nr:hypothetical protein TrST_g9034 [Triparma strigata]
MRWLDRKWHKVVEKKLNELEEGEGEYGEVIVHGGNDISKDEANSDARLERMEEQVTKVVFLLNITKAGDYACYDASILVAVDIPEGITIIGRQAFYNCTSLREMKVPDSLQTFGDDVFRGCSKLAPFDIKVRDSKAIVAYLRSIQ